jgi:hypothetical protein
MPAPPTEDEHLIRLKDLRGGGRFALTSARVEITAQNVDDKFFDLPHDAPDIAAAFLDKTIVTLNTGVQYALTDYQVTTDAAGKYRRISWDGLGLENNPPARVGDKVWTLYHVEIAAAGAETGGVSLPDGGTEGQILTKASGADGDAEWRNAPPHDDLVNRLVIPDGDDDFTPAALSDGEAALHLTELDAVWVKTNRLKRPQKPQNLSPHDGELDVYQFAEFIATNYYQSDGVEMAVMRIQIAQTSDFAAPVVDRTLFQSVTNHKLNGGELADSERTYFWRVRYQTVESQWSEWSDPTSFVTQAVFEPNVILTPRLIGPREGAAIAAMNGVLVSSPFAYEGSATTHESSSWKINSQRDGQGNEIWREDDTTTGLLATLVDANLYSVGADRTLYAGARHKGASGGYSKWSPLVGFTLRPYHTEPIIGIEETLTSEAAILRYIDEGGNYVTPVPGYFDTHPIYAAIASNVVLNGNDMAFIPAFHVKYERVDAARRRFWLSPNPEPGFSLHPAFMPSGADTGFYIGRVNSGVSNGGNSILGEATAFFSPSENVMSWFTGLNTGGQAGWHLESYYERLALSFLIFFECLSYNPTVLFGGLGSSANGGNNAPDKANWRNIYAHWRDKGNSSYTGIASNIALMGLNVGDIQSVRVISLGNPTSPADQVNSGLEYPGAAADAGNNGNTVLECYDGIIPSLGIEAAFLFLPKTLDTEGNAGPYHFTAPRKQAQTPYSYYKVGVINNCSLFVGAMALSTSSSTTLRIAKWII